MMLPDPTCQGLVLTAPCEGVEPWACVLLYYAANDE